MLSANQCLLVHLHLEEVAESILALSVDQVLTLGEAALRELWLGDWLPLRHYNLPLIK